MSDVVFVRDVDRATKAGLEAFADANGLSMSKAARAIITAAVCSADASPGAPMPSASAETVAAYRNGYVNAALDAIRNGYIDPAVVLGGAAPDAVTPTAAAAPATTAAQGRIDPSRIVRREHRL
jgi:hypothetical protein